MAGLRVDISAKIVAEIERVAGAFQAFGEKALPRAVQFNLNRVAVDGVNRFRTVIPDFWDNPVPWLGEGVWYELDRTALDRVASLDEVRSTVFIKDQQSAIWKYAFGDGVTARFGGDVGIEGWLNDQGKVYVPKPGNLAATQGMRPDAHGNFRGADIRRIAAAARGGYKPNTGSGTWPVFEIKAGASGHLKPGIYARPQRRVVPGQRRPRTESVFVPEFLGGTGKPFDVTEQGDYRRIHRMDGTTFSVPHVENLSKPRLLFVEQDEFDYEPVAVVPWQRSMQASADKFGGWMDEELADKFDHALRRGRV